ncbi:MAG: site-specific integrase, partial [Bacteroidales bacterium]|nr:site-specific integrase [Bacteroidales bacterium]
MASTSFYLDTRRAKKGEPCILKISINHLRKSAFISTGCKITEEQWDIKSNTVINHPNKDVMNMSILGLKSQIDGYLLRLSYEERVERLTASEIKQGFEGLHDPLKAEKARSKNMFESRFLKFAESKSEGTKRLYMVTHRRMQAFSEQKNFKLSSLAFEDVTKDWLSQFDQFLAQTAPSQNARNIHFRNIRAVFNEAIDDEITTAYPFRKFKLKNIATRKRNLKVEDLRMLFNYPVERYAVGYLDMFKLMFMLIGINTVDLANLKEITDGRINYSRAKTHRLYSIKVEPEALEIIERHRGENWLVDILDRYKDHKDYTKHINNALKCIGEVKRSGLGGKKTRKPLFPEIST